MLLNELVRTSRRVAETRSRRSKTAALAELLRRLPAGEIRSAVSYLAGELPGGKIGVGYAALAAARPAGAAQRPSLTLREVEQALARVAGQSGPGSRGERLRRLHSLLERASREEQEFLMRLLLGELRQGAQEGVMIEAIAAAAGVAASAVRRAWMLAPGPGEMAEAALGGGEAGLQRFGLRLLQPVQPMLAGSAGGVEEALNALGRASLEHKLDGARVQVHRAGTDVRVFSRRLNEVTERVPEVVEVVRALPASRLILDGEALVLDTHGRPAPFQVTMRRFGRRLQVEETKENLPLSVFFFDCLHLEGQDLLDRPLAERLKAMEELLPGGIVVPRLVTASPAEARAFLEGALEQGHEGVMAKSLEAAYEAGRRGGGWLKLKPFHTLDLVVLAAEWGSGRRRGWLSNLHLGAGDGRGGFLMLGKTFKGMTDRMLEWQTGRLLALETAREGHVVRVRPELVVEVSFDGVQDSPQYPGGLALRFARVRRYRPDKAARQASTIEEVRALR